MLRHLGRSLSFPLLAFRHRMFFRVALAITIVATGVLAFAGFATLWVFAKAQTRTVAALYQLQADRAAERIHGFVDNIDAQLRPLKALPWTILADEDRRIDALRALRSAPAVSTLRLLDPRGMEQLRVSRLEPDVTGSGVDFNTVEEYRFTPSGGFRLGPVYFLDGSEPYTTLYARGASPPLGGIVADVNLKLISDTVASTQIDGGGYAYLVDDAGRLLSHSEISLVLRQVNLGSLPQVQAAMASHGMAQSEALTPGRDLNGREILAAYAKVPDLGWVVVVEAPRAAVMVPVYNAVHWSLATLLGGLLLAVLAGLYVARSLLRPLKEVAAGASIIGAGDLDHRIHISGSDELSELGARFNEMARSLQIERSSLEGKVEQRTEELARANQAKSRFLAAASHDLRQPLHALGLFVDEIRASPSEGRRQILERNISTAVQSLNGMFDSILDTSKIEAGAVAPTFTSFSLKPLLDVLRETFAPSAAAKGLAFDVDDTGATVSSDQLMLMRMLQNLVANAVKYTANGKVCVSVDIQDRYAVLSVQDTGPGIAPEAQVEIFGEFYRETSRSGERGLGLGLFIVDNFSRLLNHPINVVSAPGHGSTFTIQVPLAESRLVTVLSDGARLRFGAGLRVIVIDDDQQALDAISGSLRAWGFEVEAAVGPSDCSAHEYDLLIADYDLGRDELTGLDVIEAFRGKRAGLACILVSGNPDAVGAAKDRNVDCLVKPVSPIALRSLAAAKVAALRSGGQT